jgi:hypothetical protein
MIEFLSTYTLYAQLFVLWLIITCGTLLLVLVLCMGISELIRRIMTHFKGYDLLLDHALYYSQFKEWRKKQ